MQLYLSHFEPSVPEGEFLSHVPLRFIFDPLTNLKRRGEGHLRICMKFTLALMPRKLRVSVAIQQAEMAVLTARAPRSLSDQGDINSIARFQIGRKAAETGAERSAGGEVICMAQVYGVAL